MIAVRMHVTGHDQRSIATVLREHAPEGRADENRNWNNYAERTAQAAFGPRGDREAASNLPRARSWMQVEGREPLPERVTGQEHQMSGRRIDRKSLEMEL